MHNDIVLFTGSFAGMAKPAGAYRIASELRSNGYTVQVVDNFPHLVGTDTSLLFSIIDKFVGPNTLWVGFSSTFFVNIRRIKADLIAGKSASEADNSKRDYTEAGIPLPLNEKLELRNKIKGINPKCSIVLGGGKAYAKQGDIIDAFIEGYADTTVIEFTKWLQGKNPFFQFQQNPPNKLGIPSISVVHDLKASRFNFNSSAIVWDKSDIVLPGEALPIEVSRGCIFNCSFCSYPLNGKKKLDYIKDPSLLIDEFQRNYELYGTTDYTYSDDTHNDSIQKLEMLYDEVYSKLSFKINFYTYLRLDLLAAHPQSIQLLKDSGLAGCFFGIESLNYPSAKSIGKGIKTEKAIETLYKAKEVWGNSVKTSAGFIVGLPEETEETVIGWLDEIIKPEFPLDCVHIYPLIIMMSDSKNWKSDFENDPLKYGYNFDASGKWYNGALNYDKCNDIASVYMQKAIANNKRQFSDFAIPGMLNIGMSRAALHDGIQLTPTAAAEIRQLRIKRNEIYFDRLMKL